MVILDDDPTGTQAVRDVPVFLAWNDINAIRDLATSWPAVHVMTNTRAVPAARAEEITFEAATAAHRALPSARIILRGDSTLRAHLLEEYRAVRRAAHATSPPLLLVPALPASGRVTRGGTHWLEDRSGAVPLHATEYARDGEFSYGSSRLLEWAEERSSGLFPAAAGREIPLAELRQRGSAAVARALEETAERAPAACVPDATCVEDLETIAEGLRRAESAGVMPIVRCAPAFAGVLAGTLTDELVAPPHGGDGLLIVCGSYVSGTTRQLAHLRQARGLDPVEVDVAALCADRASAEVSRVAAVVREELASRGIAIVATPRDRPPDMMDLASGARIAEGLAQIVKALDPMPGVVLAKGGITAQVVLQRGLGVNRAHVRGPIAPGVALWQVLTDGGPVDYVVFPGNVGDDDLLARVTTSILES